MNWFELKGPKYICGHDRTPENSYKNGKVGYRCKICTLSRSEQSFQKRVSTETGLESYRAYNRMQAKKYNKALRKEMIAAYGGKCVCCGESEQTFLTLEHIKGGGNQERMKYGGGRNSGAGQQSIIRRLKREGWPTGEYTILCANCNMASKWGICPHQKNYRA